MWMFIQCFIYYKKKGTIEDLQNKAKQVSTSDEAEKKND